MTVNADRRSERPAATEPRPTALGASPSPADAGSSPASSRLAPPTWPLARAVGGGRKPVPATGDRAPAPTAIDQDKRSIRMGRPPVPDPVRQPNDVRAMPTASFALRPDQIDQIRKLAAERGTSQSAVVREAIDRYLTDLVRQALDLLAEARQAEVDALARQRAGTDA